MPLGVNKLSFLKVLSSLQFSHFWRFLSIFIQNVEYLFAFSKVIDAAYKCLYQDAFFLSRLLVRNNYLFDPCNNDKFFCALTKKGSGRAHASRPLCVGLNPAGCWTYFLFVFSQKSVLKQIPHSRGATKLIIHRSLWNMGQTY